MIKFENIINITILTFIAILDFTYKLTNIGNLKIHKFFLKNSEYGFDTIFALKQPQKKEFFEKILLLVNFIIKIVLKIIIKLINFFLYI